MGTEEEIREHESKCPENHDKRSCLTCEHKRTTYRDGKYNYECEIDITIPEGMMYEFCKSYKRKEKTGNIVHDLFGGLFF